MLSEENNSKEQKNAELEVESFRKNLGPFVVAAETTRMPMAFTDAEKANHPLVFANESFLSLTGYDQKEVLGQSFDFLLYDTGKPGSFNSATATLTFGAPKRTYSIGTYRVLVWSHAISVSVNGFDPG